MRARRFNPGVTLAAISALAIGIGANTAIFSVINAVLLRPLPYPDGDRLVSICRTARGLRGPASIPKFTLWRERNGLLDSLCAYDFAGAGLNLSGGDAPELVKGIRVSLEFFDAFGVRMSLGRAFLREEDEPGGPRVVVLSDGLWKRRFGADRTIAGRGITLGEDTYTVVGVADPDFQPDPPADLWLPLQADRDSTNKGHFLRVAAKLKRGVTLDAANAQLRLIAEEFRRMHPDQMEKTESAAAVGMREELVGDVRRPLEILAGAVALVLLLACANIANLQLARAAARQKEIAIRAAIGASRPAIVWQLMKESAPLAAIGGILGLLLGCYGVRLLLAMSPTELPRVERLVTSSVFSNALDWRVLGFALGASMVTTILFGLFPALQISRTDIAATLQESRGRSSAGPRHHRTQAVLVMSEVAIAMVLLSGAIPLIRTMYALHSAAPGFEVSHILTMQMSFAGRKYSTTAAMENYETRATQRMENLPGAVAAAPMVILPGLGDIDMPFVIEGRQLAAGETFSGDEYWRFIGPHYFKVFGIVLRRGRLLNDRDRGKAAPVAIVNEAMSKKYWPNRDVLGERITVGKGMGEVEDASREIVGVVNDTHEGGVQRPVRPVIYVPSGELPDATTRFAHNVLPTTWAVRTVVDPKTMAAAIRSEFLAVDDRVAPANVRTLEEVLGENTGRQRFNTVLLEIFAAIGLVLAAIGMYGLMSYTVAQRSREIGIRLALGAQSSAIMRLVVSDGLKLAAAGVVVGLLAAYGSTRLIANMLFGVTPTDALTYGVLAGTPLVIALLASVLPAWRAMRTDAVLALREGAN